MTRGTVRALAGGLVHSTHIRQFTTLAPGESHALFWPLWIHALMHTYTRTHNFKTIKDWREEREGGNDVIIIISKKIL